MKRGLGGRALRAVLLAGLSLLLLYPFVSSANRSEGFVDEYAFISAGHAAVTRLLHGDLLGPGWTANDWADYGWPNPMLGKYAIGAAVYATGYGGREYGTWVNKLSPATADELHGARWSGILLGWGACLLLLAIGARISWATGVVASLYCAFNHSFVWSCSLAMLEAPLMFCVLLTLLLLLRLKDRLYDAAMTAGAILRSAVAIGFAAACTISAKLLGGAVFLFAPLYLAGLAIGARLRLAPVPLARRAVAAMVIVALVAPLGFYLLNPMFYRHPIAQLRGTMQFWQTRQLAFAMSRRESFEVNMNAMLSEMPTSKLLYRPLFYAIADHDHQLKNLFEDTYVAGRGSVEAVLMAIAAVSIAAQRRRLGRLAPITDEETLLAFMLFIWAVMIAWLPMVQGRYFLFPFVATPPIVAIGLCRSVAALAAAVRSAAARLIPAAANRAPLR